MREPALPPSDHDTDLPPEIDAIVLKSLAKRLDERYQSAASMRSDIERYLAGRPVQAPLVAPVVAGPPVTAATAVTAPVAAYEEEPRSRTGLIVALGLLLVLLIAGGAYLLPDLFERAPEQVPTPNVINRTEAQARVLIGDAGLAVGTIDRENNSDVAAGRVIRQDPTPDQYVDPDDTVNLVISLGKPQVEVPFVIGQDRKAAKPRWRPRTCGWISRRRSPTRTRTR